MDSGRQDACVCGLLGERLATSRGRLADAQGDTTHESRTVFRAGHLARLAVTIFHEACKLAYRTAAANVTSISVKSGLELATPAVTVRKRTRQFAGWSDCRASS